MNPTTVDELKKIQAEVLLPGGYRCEKCKATGPYPVDRTTPKNAFRILFDSCPFCDPDAEDSFRYIDAAGNVLSIL